MVGVAWELRGIHSAVDVLVRAGRAEMQTATTSWTSSGKTVSVTTTRKENETATAFATRHKEAVDAMLALYPKDQ